MKSIFAVAGFVLACLYNASAADNDEYKTMVFTPGKFTVVSSDLPCEIKYVKGECKITVRTKDKKDEPFSCGVSDGRLELKMNQRTLFVVKDGEIELSAPSLEAIEINGTGKFESETPISADTFKCALNGACKAELEGLNCKTLKIVGNGTSKIEIENLKCGFIDAQLNGAGKFELEGTASKGSFTVNGAGKIDITELAVSDVSSQVNGIGSVTRHK